MYAARATDYSHSVNRNLFRVLFKILTPAPRNMSGTGSSRGDKVNGTVLDPVATLQMTRKNG